jgi:hypothetical protein
VVFCSSAVRKAYRADIKKNCAGIKPGGGRIETCMKDHFADLSDASDCSRFKPNIRVSIGKTADCSLIHVTLFTHCSSHSVSAHAASPNRVDKIEAVQFAQCFLHLASLPNFALDRLNRYEATLCFVSISGRLSNQISRQDRDDLPNSHMVPESRLPINGIFVSSHLNSDIVIRVFLKRFFQKQVVAIFPKQQTK